MYKNILLKSMTNVYKYIINIIFIWIQKNY
jgi:hypothetical protein